MEIVDRKIDEYVSKNHQQPSVIIINLIDFREIADYIGCIGYINDKKLRVNGVRVYRSLDIKEHEVLVL